jgi:putative MATE family efflux protein
VSRVYGSGDIEKARQMSTDALTLTFLLASAAAMAGYAVIDPIFRLMGAGDVVMPLIHDYMAIWYCGLPFLGVMMVGNSCIRATGDTKFPSSMMTISALIAIVIDPFLIFGLAGFPRMELSGAATAWVVAHVVSFAISMYRLIWAKNSISRRILHSGLFDSWKRIFHVAVPAIISNQIAPISMGVITWMTASFGREAVAALGVANRIEGIVMMFFYASNASISIFSGQNHGAGNFGRVRDALNIGARFSLMFGAVCAAALWLLADILPPLFDANPDVARYASQYLHWVPLSYGALGVMILANGVFNAVGRPVPATAIIFMKAALVYIPLAWVLRGSFGFTGILMALTSTNFIMGAIAYTWNRKVVR